ncbi:MAG: hypothetical protein KA419_20915 [Acidobacteria bacterium]|nr:hypothetical protein [Acidobacteriota bacterium]
MRRSRILVAVVLGSLLFAWTNARDNEQPTPQDLELLKRATALEPFLKSAEAKQDPESVGFFFPRGLYPKLLGNPVMGYLYDEGYASGGLTRVCLKRFRFPKKVEPHVEAFKKCAQTAFEKAGLRLGDTGRIELGLALLGVVPVKNEKSLPGLCVEFYVHNRDSGKTVYARRSFGSPESLVKAMMAASVFMAARVLR